MSVTLRVIGGFDEVSLDAWIYFLVEGLPSSDVVYIGVEDASFADNSPPEDRAAIEPGGGVHDSSQLLGPYSINRSSFPSGGTFTFWANTTFSRFISDRIGNSVTVEWNSGFGFPDYITLNPSLAPLTAASGQIELDWAAATKADSFGDLFYQVRRNNSSPPTAKPLPVELTDDVSYDDTDEDLLAGHHYYYRVEPVWVWNYNSLTGIVSADDIPDTSIIKSAKSNETWSNIRNIDALTGVGGGDYGPAFPYSKISTLGDLTGLPGGRFFHVILSGLVPGEPYLVAVLEEDVIVINQNTLPIIFVFKRVGELDGYPPQTFDFTADSFGNIRFDSSTVLNSNKTTHTLFDHEIPLFTQSYIVPFGEDPASTFAQAEGDLAEANRNALGSATWGNADGNDNTYYITGPVTVTATGTTSEIFVEWNASDVIDTRQVPAYVVQRSTHSDMSSSTDIAITTNLSYEDKTAVAGTTYYYRIFCSYYVNLNEHYYPYWFSTGGADNYDHFVSNIDSAVRTPLTFDMSGVFVPLGS